MIGGDDHYTNEDEKERTVISRWARRKVASQFSEEYLDGRKSFIFSWNKKHREIHEEALLHYFDPSKKGQKFEYQPKPKPAPPLPKPDEPKEVFVCCCLFAILLEKYGSENFRHTLAPSPQKANYANVSIKIIILRTELLFLVINVKYIT